VDFLSRPYSLENDALESDILTNTCSPYTEPPATLLIRPDKIAYFVPQNFLPSGWVSSGSQEPFCFPDVDIQTGHTLVHYLYKGSYEAPVANNSPTSLHACTKLKAALLVYIATNDHALPRLQHLATSEIEEHGSRLDLVEILDAIDGDFSKLCQDSWVHEYLRRKVKVAFEQDHTIFTKEAFLQNLSNTALIKFMARYIVDLYNTKLCYTIATEKKLCQRSDTQDQYARGRAPADDSHVKDCCGPDIEDPVASDNFYTISCPPSEFSDCEVEACLHGSIAVDNCEKSEQAIEEICYEPCEVLMEAPVESEPGVSECVPDSPQSAACEPTWEHWKDEVTSVPTEREAVDYDVLVEPRPGHNNPLQESARASRCRFEARHILEGDEWRTCDRCREAVKNLRSKFRLQSKYGL
jgi:hypothetical protein